MLYFLMVFSYMGRPLQDAQTREPHDRLSSLRLPTGSNEAASLQKTRGILFCLVLAVSRNPIVEKSGNHQNMRNPPCELPPLKRASLCFTHFWLSPQAGIRCPSWIPPSFWSLCSSAVPFSLVWNGVLFIAMQGSKTRWRRPASQIPSK